MQIHALMHQPQRILSCIALSFATYWPCTSTTLAFNESVEAYEQMIEKLPSTTQVAWQSVLDNERFPLLLRPNQSAQQLGTIIIIPAPGQHADWPGYIRTLRNGLPRHGWNTIAMSLLRVEPAMDKQNMAQDMMMQDQMSGADSESGVVATASSDKITFSAPDNNSSDSVPPMDPNASNIARLQTTFAHAQTEFPAPYLIFATGSSAGTVMSYLAQDNSFPASVVVLVNAHSTEQLTQQIEQNSAMIVELIAEHNPHRDQILERATLLQQTAQNHYFIKVFPSGNPNFEHQEHALLKTVRGLLNRLVQK